MISVVLRWPHGRSSERMASAVTPFMAAPSVGGAAWHPLNDTLQYHCINCCVRRAVLRGHDEFTGAGKG